MFLKKLFYASASIFLLALAYHLGATTATAQAPSNPIVAMPAEHVAVTANGDLYWSSSGSVMGPFQRVGNVFTGAATPATTQSFGSLKAKYR